MAKDVPSGNIVTNPYPEDTVYTDPVVTPANTEVVTAPVTPATTTKSATSVTKTVEGSDKPVLVNSF